MVCGMRRRISLLLTNTNCVIRSVTSWYCLASRERTQVLIRPVSWSLNRAMEVFRNPSPELVTFLHKPYTVFVNRESRSPLAPGHHPGKDARFFRNGVLNRS